MNASRRSTRCVAPVGALLVCALAAPACGGKKGGPAERSLAACGLDYQVPDGWTAVDPSTAPAYTFPAIGPKASVAELDAPDGTHVVVQCVAQWTKATTTTCDQASTAVGFDDYVRRCHEFYGAGPLASAVSHDELPLGDGGTLALTTARLASGLVDGTESTTGFGAARVGGLHVVVRASGSPSAFDRAGLATLVASIRPR